ncbi:LysR family transcriptional regulator [Ensifer sp.]|jgi:DNA-binding transcriptional LysR family regulator|uniref:LysR family transcriptional regulator n=1 Tax=Ensifer sp. TaxID=1872086 RepID=UPI002E0FCE68|nr:LysR family transcriptional regulator [Ensifer sp.]
MLDALTLDQLRVFVAIVDHGSFRAAARVLNRAQSGLSSAILNLEAELRLPLFDRSQHRPVLTEEGATLLAEARTLLIKADALRARANGFNQGMESSLRVALDPLLPLPDIAEVLRAFATAHPAVRIELVTAPMTMAMSLVLDGDCDLGLTAAQETDPHIASEAVAAFPGMVPVCGPDHPLAVLTHGAAGLTTVDLADHLQIVVADPTVDMKERSYAVLSQQRLRVSDLATKHALIVAGAGWGHLPLWLVAADLDNGRLVEVQLAARKGLEQPLLPFYAIRRIDRVRGPAMESLSHLLAAHFRNPPPKTIGQASETTLSAAPPVAGGGAE